MDSELENEEEKQFCELLRYCDKIDRLEKREKNKNENNITYICKDA
jgi:hypothetical protein